jgi:hypothetical protein
MGPIEEISTISSRCAYSFQPIDPIALVGAEPVARRVIDRRTPSGGARRFGTATRVYNPVASCFSKGGGLGQRPVLARFGSVRRNYGLLFPVAVNGAGCEATNPPTYPTGRNYFGGDKDTIGGWNHNHRLSSREDSWTLPSHFLKLRMPPAAIENKTQNRSWS